MFEKILIANRGEIACRVIRTAKAMGIRTVAVFSDADAKALHVEMADEAIHIGPPPARDSYLRIDKILGAAQRTGAQAIHPGYGFLSENADFAEACAAAGIVFVGPTPAAIRAMGSKAEAKRLMQAAGVPLVPGYHGEDQDDDLLAAKAAIIGFPVLIKASAGGGGRGMRAVERAEDFAIQLAAARREAEAAFGDGRVLLERYLQRPRHIEVQLLGDTHGTLLHLGTRDCSIQRRHQKIVEEAPAPGLSDATRERIHQAALAAGRAVNYTNAGTVEFIAEGIGPDPSFYFMEMNTRLQVEHPVTEEVYGIDLVEQQLRVAAGESLTLSQADVAPRGHAIEVRLCAENPQQDFRPSTGKIFGFKWSHGQRLETGFRDGDVIGPHYDNLIAKNVCFAEARENAVIALQSAMACQTLAGLKTNLDLLRRIARHEAFAAGELDTGFLARHQADLVVEHGETPPLVPIIAAVYQQITHRPSKPAQPNSNDSGSPWKACRGFRLNGPAHGRIAFRDNRRTHVVTFAYAADGDRVRLPDGRFVRFTAYQRDQLWVGAANERDFEIAADLGGVLEDAMIVRDGSAYHVTRYDDLRAYDLVLLDPYAPPDATTAAADRIAAPIPALVTRVDVAPGNAVTRGQVLAVLEAMKTEIRIAAPADGIVAKVLVTAGQQVSEGFELVTLEAPPPPAA
jgi:3-methylcrotonyl-CoA carboxylase alpha subunit